MSSAKPLVFISYAHKDGLSKPLESGVDWLKFVLEHLRPGEKAGRYSLWVDLKMMGSADWEAEIEQKIRDCDIFILLVSRRSMSSDFILDRELPIVRERDARGEPIRIYPVILTPTAVVGLDYVRDKNIRPRDAKPLSGFSDHDRDLQMAGIANEVAALSTSIASRSALPRGTVGPTSQGTGQAHGLLIDVGRLPETSYKTLIGRDAELARLDAVWEDRNVNIISLVAEGGAGKSALVNEWLTRLRRDNYRNAEAVLGWSFFSQGSEKRASSADEFLNWALAKLEVRVETTSASVKGEAIAEALTTRRVLLLFDGVEPLQHGPGPQEGQLKDLGLRALLRRFAVAPPRIGHSLIVLTSRVAVANIKGCKDEAAPVVDVERLSDEAGAELLRDNDVWGIDKELRAASGDFGGHPLALTLLAGFLKETQNGDVRRRDHIRGLLADTDNPRHDQARRVMESCEKEWLADQPILLAILHCVGLFDRPASGDCLKALRAKPAIPGLTDALDDLSDDQWRRAVARLRGVRLLAPIDPSDPEALDAHPLVREWFSERLKSTNEAAWKEAHSRLYDHLRRTTHEGVAPTLADLAPLYHAVAHGCCAGRHQEALDEVYRNRICRRLANGQTEFYSHKKLGAAANNLAAISWFFDQPYETPAAALTPPRHFVLNQASFGLRAQGRLQETLSALRAAVRIAKEINDWKDAAVVAGNLSEVEVLVGRITAAATTAEASVEFADRSGDGFQMLFNRAIQADALHAAGEWEKAADLFADAERRQRERRPESLLHSVQGYRYCDLLLSLGRAVEVRDRAAQILPWAKAQSLVFDVALYTLALGRAHLALALRSVASEPQTGTARDDAHAAAAKLEEAVEGLQATGQSDDIPPARPRHLPLRHRRLGPRGAQPRWGRGDRRAGADAALPMRLRARARAASAGAS